MKRSLKTILVPALPKNSILLFGVFATLETNALYGNRVEYGNFQMNGTQLSKKEIRQLMGITVESEKRTGNYPVEL